MWGPLRGRNIGWRFLDSFFLKIMSLVIRVQLIWNGPQPTGEEHVLHVVESYTISYAMITILRWRMLPAQEETTHCTRVYVKGGRWTELIFNSSTCDLVYPHWFLQGFLVIFKISTQLRWWLILHRNSTVVHGDLDTYLDLTSVFKIKRSGTTVQCSFHQQ